MNGGRGGTRQQPADAEPVAEEQGRLLASDGVSLHGEDEDSATHSMTPRAVLTVFSLLNFATYFDRGAIAGCLSTIKVDKAIRGGHVAVSDTRGGVVVSAFMIGYMVTCPLFAALGAYLRAKHLILAGMLVWSVACLSTAVSSSYKMLLCSRLLVGVGEAAFVGFTVTIIDNIAPAERRTSWIGAFYAMVPVGTATGMAVGGLVSERHNVFGSAVQSWRLVFLGEVAATMPVLFAIAAMPAAYDVDRPSPPLSQGHAPPDVDLLTAVQPSATAELGPRAGRAEDAATPYLSLPAATKLLLQNANYLLVVAGFAMYCFVVGAIAVWAIPMLTQGPLRMPVSKAAIVVGVSTSLCGVVGSLLGGWAVDRFGGSRGLGGSVKCQLFATAMMVFCVPCGVVAFFQVSLAPFIVAFAASVLALFSVTAPVNASILTVVPHQVRPYAVSYSVFVIHFLGDFPSPTIAGALSDRFSRGCAAAADVLSCHGTPQASGFLRDRECLWVEDRAAARQGPFEPAAGHCVNTYQLRDTLLIIFAFLVLAVPCWAAVYVRLRREATREHRQNRYLESAFAT